MPRKADSISILRGKLIMVSSTVHEIKQDAKDVADDIASRAQDITADVTVESREALGNIGDRVAREGGEIKSEVEALLAKAYDLLRPEVSHEIRQHVRQSWDGFSEATRGFSVVSTPAAVLLGAAAAMVVHRRAALARVTAAGRVGGGRRRAALQRV